MEEAGERYEFGVGAGRGAAGALTG
jgi:hypothetical protein